MDSFLSNLKSWTGTCTLKDFPTSPFRHLEPHHGFSARRPMPVLSSWGSTSLGGQATIETKVIMDDPTQRKCIKMWNVRPLAVFCCHFSMQFLRIAIRVMGLRAMLSLKHVGQILQVVNFRHVSFSFGEHPETTTWWWWWWWIWRISLVLMAIPEVICFRVVTQDLSYNYICRRWTPNWGCPCRKQYVLLQETMAQTAQAACALDMSCVSWADEKLHWEDVGFISCPTIRTNIREKQTRAAWLINFKHHHVEFWISGPGQKNQEFVTVKSSKKMASGLRRVV